MTPLPSASAARSIPGLRIGWSDLQRRLQAAAPSDRRARLLWAGVALAGLALFSAYVSVLRDAVQRGEALRAGFQQASAAPARAVPAPETLWASAAPRPR